MKTGRFKSTHYKLLSYLNIFACIKGVLCCHLRLSDGVPEKMVNLVSQDWLRPRSTQRLLLLVVSTHAPASSHTTLPVKTSSQSFCVNQEIPVCVGRGPPYNASTLAAVSSICSLCIFFESFDISLTVR